MSTSAHERPCWQSKCAARDIANSLFQKWAIKGFFPESPCRWLSLRTFFRHRKKSTSAPSGRPVPVRAGVGASNPHRQKKACTCGRTKGLSSGQTIGAVRTAVRSACCLPERRVAKGPSAVVSTGYPLPFVPLWKPSAPKVGKVIPWSCKPSPPARSRRVKPSAGTFYSKTGFLPPLAQMKRTLPVIKPARFFTPHSLPF